MSGERKEVKEGGREGGNKRAKGMEGRKKRKEDSISFERRVF